MRKLVGCKIYDTKNATKIASFQTKYAGPALEDYEEILYRTTNGEYFLYCRGNSTNLSSVVRKAYSESKNHSLKSGRPSTHAKGLISVSKIERIEELVPLQEFDAKDWLKHYEPERYRQLFVRIENSPSQVRGMVK